MLIERIRGYFTHLVAGTESDGAAERRRAHRKSVYLRATIHPIDVFSDVRIRNVSATGAKGEADVELAIGQTLHVTTDERVYHTGTVRWTRDRQFGLNLPDARDIVGLPPAYSDHGSEEGHHPRSQRTKVNIAARLVGGRPPRPAIVCNLSAGGLLLDTSPGLESGQHLVVRICNAPPIYGRAQWSSNGRIGFKAQHPISVLTIACTAE